MVLAKVIFVILAIGTLMALGGVWFPEWFKTETAHKLIWSFVVIAVSSLIATGTLQYIN